MTIVIHAARRRRLTSDELTRQHEEEVLQQARDILLRRLGSPRLGEMTRPQAVKDYLRFSLVGVHHEEFWALMLDAQHRLISAEKLFVGTLTQTSVYPREVVKAVLAANAAAVIFAHNHPSGVAEPSQADELLTRNLRSALALVDVKVLDHHIVAGAEVMSFAEKGLI